MPWLLIEPRPYSLIRAQIREPFFFFPALHFSSLYLSTTYCSGHPPPPRCTRLSLSTTFTIVVSPLLVCCTSFPCTSILCTIIYCTAISCTSFPVFRQLSNACFLLMTFSCVFCCVLYLSNALHCIIFHCHLLFTLSGS